MDRIAELLRTWLIIMGVGAALQLIVFPILARFLHPRPCSRHRRRRWR